MVTPKIPKISQTEFAHFLREKDGCLISNDLFWFYLLAVFLLLYLSIEMIHNHYIAQKPDIFLTLLNRKHFICDI